ALARLWMSWGVTPAAMIGHSTGEYVAACIAGVFEPEGALRLVAARARLMQGLPAGAMLLVSLPRTHVAGMLGQELELAAASGPGYSVGGGPEGAVRSLERRLEERGVECRRLHVSHGAHSKMVEPMMDPFRQLVRATPRHAPRIPYVSNLTGRFVTAAE